MRHAFASRMISRGISSTVLAALMGHESSTITERRYLLLFDRQRMDEQVRRAMSLVRLASAGRISGLTWREAIGTGWSRGLAGEEA